MNTTKIRGRATFQDQNGTQTERGFSFDDMEGFTRYLNSNLTEIVNIEFIK